MYKARTALNKKEEGPYKVKTASQTEEGGIYISSLNTIFVSSTMILILFSLGKHDIVLKFIHSDNYYNSCCCHCCLFSSRPSQSSVLYCLFPAFLFTYRVFHVLQGISRISRVYVSCILPFSDKTLTKRRTNNSFISHLSHSWTQLRVCADSIVHTGSC